VTTEIDKVGKYFSETISALKDLGIQYIMVSGNNDAGYLKIKKIIKDSKLRHYENLSFIKYISLLRSCSVIVGNSSSGIMEAPFLRIPTVNIGTRQQGRSNTKSIINVGYDRKEIMKAINKAIYDKKFLSAIKKQQTPYGDGNAAKKTVQILERLDLRKIPIQKKLTY
jgi:UDP-N-acetylglucosamine 2-epimerase (non-hydrolysing)/GDP/UDP-N,N'-diacetylbacillosamine 2-epimerase (hydrolysing)